MVETQGLYGVHVVQIVVQVGTKKEAPNERGFLMGWGGVRLEVLTQVEAR